MVSLCSFHQALLFLRSKAGKTIVATALAIISRLGPSHLGKIWTWDLYLHPVFSVPLFLDAQDSRKHRSKQSSCLKDPEISLGGRDKGLPDNLFSGKGRAGNIPGSLQISHSNESSQ